MGKHSSPEMSEDEAVAAANIQPMLAINRLGLEGRPYLAISSRQRSSETEFSKPGCQYSIGSIAVHKWRNGHAQQLFVSLDKNYRLAVVTSRLYYPHTQPADIMINRSPEGVSELPEGVKFIDYDYHYSDDDLLQIHRGRLSGEVMNYADPTPERLAMFYNRLIETAVYANLHPAP